MGHGRAAPRGADPVVAIAGGARFARLTLVAFQAVYNVSKAFVHGCAEAIRTERKDSGATVTTLQPGAIDTHVLHRAGMEDTTMGSAPKDDPAQVARDGFEATMAGTDHVVAGSLKNKVQAVPSQVTPETAKAQVHRGTAEPGSGQT